MRADVIVREGDIVLLIDTDTHSAHGCSQPQCFECNGDMRLIGRDGSDQFYVCDEPGCDGRLVLRETRQGVVWLRVGRRTPAPAPHSFKRVVRELEYRPDGLVSKITETHFLTDNDDPAAQRTTTIDAPAARSTRRLPTSSPAPLPSRPRIAARRIGFSQEG